MTDQEWEVVCAVLREGWPGDWTPTDTSAALKVMLGGEDAQATLAALHAIARQPGRKFRPSVSEILGEIAHDPSLPTWAEARHAIWDGGITAAGNEDDGLARADAVHPALGAFVALKGWQALRMAPVADPEYGELRLKELAREWADHLESWQHRGAHRAALAAVGRRGSLAKLEPLAAIGRLRSVAAIERGE